MMPKSTRFLLAILAGLVVAVPAFARSADKVRAWEGSITLPTYALPEQDPNPHFKVLGGGDFYPYSKQDLIGRAPMDVEHPAWFLENRYLKVVCLPKLGGRIYQVLDKATGEDMFYRNPAIKPGLIGMRGAWFSGGIDWNAGPYSHGVTSFSPVHVTAAPEDGGAMSLVIGDTDQTMGTKWCVRLTLHPDRAYLDETITLSNPADGTHTFYFWNNTAFPEREGTRFIYPMSLASDHSAAQFFRFPINDGVDLTWLRNYPDPTSLFSVDCVYGFFGAYDVDADRGIVQSGDHHALQGKKAWTWGQSDLAYHRQGTLADDGSRYIEVQSGPLPTQADLGLLGPREERTWREWWYPVHGLGGGFEFATRDVAVQTARLAGEGKRALELRIIATGVFKDAWLFVARGEEVLYQQRAGLSPDAPVRVVAPIPDEAPVSIRIVDGAGALLAAFDSPLPIPPVDPPEAVEHSPESAEEHFLAGLRARRRQQAGAARSHFEQALAADPGHARTLHALAVMDYQRGAFAPAMEKLERAVARDPHFGAAWYQLGAARLDAHWDTRAPALESALDAAHQAAQDIRTAAVAHDLIGRVYMRMGLPEKAVEAFAAAVQRNPRDTVAAAHLAAAYLASGDTGAARQAGDEAAARDPLALLPGAVAALSRGKEDEMAANALPMLGEVEYAVLGLGLDLARLGMPAEAARAVEAFAGAKGSPIANRPLPHYAIAYFRYLANLDPAGERVRWAAAAPADTLHVFPSRAAMDPVLRYAVQADPADGAARLYLGNLYAHLGRVDAAAVLWQEALDADAALHVAARNLAVYCWRTQNDTARAAEFFRTAIAAAPAGQTLYRDLATVLVALEQPAEAVALLESMPELPVVRGDVTMLLAETLVKLGEHARAADVLARSEISTWEAQTRPHEIWVEAHMALGIAQFDAGNHEQALARFETALDYPPNLGMGRPSAPSEAKERYWQGRALEALGREDEACAAWEAGAAGPGGSAEQNEHKEKCREALAAVPKPAEGQA